MVVRFFFKEEESRLPLQDPVIVIVPPAADDELDDDQAESEAPISERASSAFDPSYVSPADAARRVQFQIGTLNGCLEVF